VSNYFKICSLLIEKKKVIIIKARGLPVNEIIGASFFFRN